VLMRLLRMKRELRWRFQSGERVAFAIPYLGIRYGQTNSDASRAPVERCDGWPEPWGAPTKDGAILTFP